MSQHLCSPREGRLNDVYKVFRCLQKNISNNLGRIAFDPAFEHKDEKVFWGSTIELEYCKDFYPDAAEAHLKKNLELLGGPVTVGVYVDANQAGNLAKSRSHSGILVYFNNALINFYRNRYNTVESSSFGLDFVALRIAT